jgi:spore germination protein KC
MRWAVRALALFALLVLLAGCWNRRELNSLQIVVGTGIDLGRQGRVRLTAQFVNPGGVRASAGGLGSGSGGGPEAFFTLSAEGWTIFEAVRNLVMASERKAYFAHNQVLVVSEEAARRGIQPYLDFFARGRETRTTTYLFVSRGKAEDLLKVRGETEKIPALSLAAVADVARTTGRTEAVMVHDFLNRLVSGTTDSVVTTVAVRRQDGEERLLVGELCAFKGDRLVGHLTPTESRGYLWITGRMRSGAIVVSGPGGKGKVSFESIHATGRIVPKLDRGRVRMTVEVHDDCALVGTAGSARVATPEDLSALEGRKVEVIRRDIRAAVRRTQELGTDLFGFGEAVHRRYPQAWRELKPRWEQVFRRLEVEVKVTARIVSTGLLARPPRPR